MSDNPHSLLAEHRPIPIATNYGHTLGYATNCRACQRSTYPPCWCGAQVGPATSGLECLISAEHDWWVREADDDA